MKYKFKLFGLYLPFFALIAVATVTMRSVALFTQFNFKSGYFTEKALISVADYLIIASVIFFFTYIFTARKDISLIPNFTSSATYIPTGLAGVAIAFLAVELFGRASKIYNEKSQFMLTLIMSITIVLAVLSIVHFVLTALIEEHSSTRRADFGICTVLFLCFYVIYLYFSSEILFESHLPINAPNKIVDQMAYLFAAVFFLYETRLSLGREKWRSYIAFGFIGALICAYSSIPSIIIYFAEGKVVSNSIYESALTFALFIFILSRLLLSAYLIEDSESSTVSAIAAAANARELELNPIIDESEVIDISGEPIENIQSDESDDNQLTIDDISEAADSESDVNEDNSSKESDDGETAYSEAEYGYDSKNPMQPAPESNAEASAPSITENITDKSEDTE